MKNKKYFLEFLDNDIIKGNIKKIPQSIFDRISLLKEKAKLAKNKNRCYICKSPKAKKVWVEMKPYGFHDLQLLCQGCINNEYF